MNRSALILEGGGVRGIFSAGVLDSFLENNIEFDTVIAVSAGALFGVNFLSKQSGRAVRYNKKYNKDFKYMGLYPLLKEGNIVSTKYAYNDVPRKLDPFDNEAYKKSLTQMYAVVTNVETGKPEYIKVDDVFEQMDTLRASGSIPVVSKAVEINGNKYLDGGISDSIPFEWAIERNYEHIVVVLTRDIDYRKKPESKLLIGSLKNKYPCIYEQMLHRHENYNMKIEKLKELEKEGRVFIIRPFEPIEAGRLERDEAKIQNSYDSGKNTANKMMSGLKEYLGCEGDLT